MLKTMFDPEGRIGPVAFRDAAIILIGAGALFSLLPLIAPSLALLSFLSLLLIYPWVVVWVKRFHDAGKPGAMFLVVLVLWLIVGVAANYFITRRFAGPPPTVDPQNIMASMTAQMQASAGVGTIVSVINALIFALGGNALLKSDPGPNAYDPPDHLR